MLETGERGDDSGDGGSGNGVTEMECRRLWRKKKTKRETLKRKKKKKGGGRRWTIARYLPTIFFVITDKFFSR